MWRNHIESPRKIFAQQTRRKLTQNALRLLARRKGISFPQAIVLCDHTGVNLQRTQIGVDGLDLFDFENINCNCDRIILDLSLNHAKIGVTVPHSSVVSVLIRGADVTANRQLVLDLRSRRTPQKERTESSNSGGFTTVGEELQLDVVDTSCWKLRRPDWRTLRLQDFWCDTHFKISDEEERIYLIHTMKRKLQFHFHCEMTTAGRIIEKHNRGEQEHRSWRKSHT